MCDGITDCACGCVTAPKSNITFDLAIVSENRHITDEGYLKAKARLARTGVQQYRAYELGLDASDPSNKFAPGDIVNVYRPPEEVFDELSMESFEGQPVTNDHPPELVNVDNIANYQVGYVSKDVRREGDYLVTDIIITDKSVIDAIMDGKAELSNGYTATYEVKSGTTPDGSPFDVVQKNIKGNHIAIVDNGRCGGECRIVDSAESLTDTKRGSKQMAEPAKKLITVCDEIIEIPAGAEVVVKELRDKINAMGEEIKAKDDELFTLREKMQAQEDEYSLMRKKSEEDTANAENVSLDERIEIIDTARSVIDNYDYKGKSNLDIKRDVISARSKDVVLDAKPEAYVNARFDIVKEQLSAEPSEKLNKMVGDSLAAGHSNSARAEMLKANANAWRKK